METHGARYNYSKFEYVEWNVKGIIICSEHGEFLQDPNHHTYGRVVKSVEEGLGKQVSHL